MQTTNSVGCTGGQKCKDALEVVTSPKMEIASRNARNTLFMCLNILTLVVLHHCGRNMCMG